MEHSPSIASVDTGRSLRKSEAPPKRHVDSVRRALAMMEPAAAVSFLGTLLREQAHRIPTTAPMTVVDFGPIQEALGLTRRQGVIYAWVVRYMAKNGIPPTLREIGKANGIRSTNGVNDHLRALERKGAIVRGDMIARGIRLVDHDVSELPR